MSRLRSITLLILLLTALLSADDKKKQRVLYVKPEQTADLEPAKVITAKQKCENWALAAGLETLFKREGVAFDQNYWVTRLSGAEVCHQELPSPDDFAHAVSQDVVLSDGRHVHLEATLVSGAPTDIDAIIAGIKRQQLALLLWHGHPYYLTGVTYDERIGANGWRLFEVRELRLADTFEKLPAATFQKGRDNADEINGLVTVSVTPQ
jgi:hypothetical protein